MTSIWGTSAYQSISDIWRIFKRFKIAADLSLNSPNTQNAVTCKSCISPWLSVIDKTSFYTINQVGLVRVVETDKIYLIE